MMLAVLILAVGFVAFTNGANANFKGVASLYGSGTTSLRQAAWWGTVMTFAGSVVSVFLASEILKVFSGRGLVADSLAATPDFLASVALGAAATSFLATRFGFPVSTTHALVGALLGTGLAGSGDVQFPALLKNFVYPLLFSPAVAAVLGVIVYFLLKAFHLVSDERSTTLDALHFLSTGGASFARGLNDTPKMAALLLLVPGFAAHWALLFVGVLIALGGLLDIRRVAETLGKKLTGMNPGQGFAASVVTAGLVTTASLHAMPVSTTHVSVGALVGIGGITRRAYWRKVAEVFAAWLTTVPCAAVLAALAYLGISALQHWR
jgi:inorganic phosphate transporter, PiT family